MEDAEEGIITDAENKSNAQVENEVEDALENTNPDASPEDIEAAANAITKAADETNSGAIAIADPGDQTVSESRIRSVLELCYEKNMRNLDAQDNRGPKAPTLNVLLSGLPGSAKTGVVESWAKEHDLVVVAVSATNEKLDQAINGLPVVKQEKIRQKIENGQELTDEEETMLETVYSKDIIKELLNVEENSRRCILFVDEFNRQGDPVLRRPLMSLFNEKRNATGTLSFKDTLLFTVAAINPPMESDPGAGELIPAEYDRFLFREFNVNSNAEDTKEYLYSVYTNSLLRCGVMPPKFITKKLIVKNPNGLVAANDGKLIPEFQKTVDRDLIQLDLAHKILNDSKFKQDPKTGIEQGFDDDFEANEIYRRKLDARGKRGKDATEDANAEIMTSRSFCATIQSADSVSDFLRLVDVGHWTRRVKNLLHTILDTHQYDKAYWYAECGIGSNPVEHTRDNGDDGEEDDFDDKMFVRDKTNDQQAVSASSDVEVILSQMGGSLF